MQVDIIEKIDLLVSCVARLMAKSTLPLLLLPRFSSNSFPHPLLAPSSSSGLIKSTSTSSKILPSASPMATSPLHHGHLPLHHGHLGQRLQPTRRHPDIVVLGPSDSRRTVCFEWDPPSSRSASTWLARTGKQEPLDHFLHLHQNQLLTLNHLLLPHLGCFHPAPTRRQI